MKKLVVASEKRLTWGCSCRHQSKDEEHPRHVKDHLSVLQVARTMTNSFSYCCLYYLRYELLYFFSTTDFGFVSDVVSYGKQYQKKIWLFSARLRSPPPVVLKTFPSWSCFLRRLGSDHHREIGDHVRRHIYIIYCVLLRAYPVRLFSLWEKRRLGLVLSGHKSLLHRALEYY